MKKTLDYFLAFVLFVFICISTSANVYAYEGSWQKDNIGWWWRESTGDYPRSQWKRLKRKWYYFHANGYMAHDEWIGGKYYVGTSGSMYTDAVTPDGYKVDETGAWVPNYYDKNLNKEFSEVVLYSDPSSTKDKGDYYECVVYLDGTDDESNLDNGYATIVRVSKNAKVHWDASDGKGYQPMSLSSYIREHSYYMRMFVPKLDSRGYIIKFSDILAE